MPIIGKYIPSVTAEMSKEKIRTLRNNGINLISLDNIEKMMHA
ncbi:MAG: hypothetical protein AB8U25_06995 [Rickettsiales endosymbiont of Dermacentor nuttalli]